MVASALLLGSCYEDAVTEKLFLDFQEEGAVIITSSVQLLPSPDSQRKPLLARLREVRSELENERDAWSRRFQSLEPFRERRTWEKETGELRRVEHAGEADPALLQRFFADTGLTVAVTDGKGWRELAIYPASSTRATMQQRALVASRLSNWSAGTSAYLSALARLYWYLDDHPDRAYDTLGDLLNPVLRDETKQKLGKLSEDEQSLVHNVGGAMKPITDSLEVAEKEAYSLDELSSLVYDPFPAQLTVRVPGKILESEGFERAEENTLHVPPLRLWNALESQTLWITPDPLITLVNASRSGNEPIDLDAFVTRERRITAVPTSADIRRAVEERLTRRPGTYRVRWSIREESRQPTGENRS